MLWFVCVVFFGLCVYLMDVLLINVCCTDITSNILLFQSVQMQCSTVQNVQHITIAQHVMVTLWLMLHVMDVQVRSLYI